MQGRELPINPEDVSIQPPNIADFLSPKLMQALDQLSVREKGMANLQHSSEGTLSPPLSPRRQNTPSEFAEDADYFETLSAEVAASATRAIDYWSLPLRSLERQSGASAAAKAAAFPLTAGAADALLAATGEAADDAQSAAPHVTAEESTADEDASGWEWWW